MDLYELYIYIYIFMGDLFHFFLVIPDKKMAQNFWITLQPIQKWNGESPGWMFIGFTLWLFNIAMV